MSIITFYTILFYAPSRCLIKIIENVLSIFLLCSKARFGTIAGITDRNKENDDSSDEEGQTFYAGGSETRYECVFTFYALISILISYSS